MSSSRSTQIHACTHSVTVKGRFFSGSLPGSQRALRRPRRLLQAHPNGTPQARRLRARTSATRRSDSLPSFWKSRMCRMVSQPSEATLRPATFSV